MMDHPDYQALASVLQAAYDQAATGKGAERHARGNPFHKQHMQSISTLLNSDKGMAYQAIKKLTEGLDFTDPDRRERELLGVIVYVAGLIVWHREHATKQHEQESRIAVAIDKLASHATSVLHNAATMHVRFAPEYPVCPDCGAPEGELHYVLCPHLPVPEAHAEAIEAAFAEQAQFDEARADIIGQNGNDGEHYEKPINVNDWRTWKVGDVLEAITDYREGDNEPWVIRQGEMCVLLAAEPTEYDGDCPIRVQRGTWMGWPDHQDYDGPNPSAQRQLFHFHHRPAKTDE